MDLSKLARGLSVASSLLEGKGPLTPEVLLSGIFSGRFSDADSYFDSPDSLVQMNQRDFADLQNREVVRFLSGNHYLYGYLYKNPLARGLVVCVHGIKGMADDQYAMVAHAFYHRGFHVFAFDLTSSGRSDGLSMPGLQQSGMDVANAYQYLHSRSDLSSIPCFAFGHSWGAYGVGASLALGAKFKAVACAAGFYKPIEEMIAVPATYAGSLVETTRGQLEEALKARDPLYYDLSAEEGVRNSGIPSLIIQGDEDKTVPLRKASLYGALEKNRPAHVSLLLQKGMGHMDVLFDPRSYAYRERMEEELKPRKKEFGKRLSAWPKAEKEAFQSLFSKPMAGMENGPVFDAAADFFVHAL